jgi:predicted kinase
MLGLRTERAIFLISGTQGAGKSTVGRALAERFERGVYIEADLVQRMIVSGGVWPEPPEPTGEALQQLQQRAHRSAMLADSFFEAGFTVVVDDIAIGDQFDIYRNGIRGRPFLLVNLVPSLEVQERRNKERPNKNVFHPWGPILDRAMRETMRDVGMWLDNSSLCVTETVDEILRRAWVEAMLP